MAKFSSGNLSKFVMTNGSASLTGRTEGEAWDQFMRSQGATGSGLDLEKNWLRIKGGRGETVSDLWNYYLNSKGFVAGTLGDRQRAFFEGGTQA